MHGQHKTYIFVEAESKWIRISKSEIGVVEPMSRRCVRYVIIIDIIRYLTNIQYVNRSYPFPESRPTRRWIISMHSYTIQSQTLEPPDQVYFPCDCCLHACSLCASYMCVSGCASTFNSHGQWSNKKRTVHLSLILDSKSISTVDCVEQKTSIKKHNKQIMRTMCWRRHSESIESSRHESM